MLPNPYATLEATLTHLFAGEAGRTLLWKPQDEREQILEYIDANGSWVEERFGDTLPKLRALYEDDGKHWDREVSALARKLEAELELNFIVTIQLAWVKILIARKSGS